MIALSLDNLHTVQKILDENLYMTISVSNSNGNPWIANLFYVYDKNYTFYWYSPKNSRHSHIIRTNPDVALAIFDSTATGDDVDAVYIQANAYEVSSKSELLKGLTLYGKKLLGTHFIRSYKAIEMFIKRYQDFKGGSPLRMYKAVPKKVWKLAPSKAYHEKFVDSRIEVPLHKPLMV